MAYLSSNPFRLIIDREIPADIVYETDEIIAFRDISPQAKTHILICPKVEIVSAMDVTEDNSTLFGQLFVAAKQIATTEGLEGYKLHMNVGEAGGQIVPHVHLHLLSPDYKSSL